MDLWCTAGRDDCGDKKIILPNEVEIQSLELFSNKVSQNDKIEDKPQKSEITNHLLDPVLSVTKMADLTHQNIERIENSNHYSVGDNDEKLYLGPSLQVILQSTYAEITGNKMVFFDKNPIGADGRYLDEIRKPNRVGITPASDDEKDLLIVVFQNGCVIVKAGGFLFCDLPVVIVASNGNYSTISGGSANTLRLQPGSHLAILAKLGIPVPILFMRRSKQSIKEIKANNKSQEKKTNEDLVLTPESEEMSKLYNQCSD